MRCPYSRDSCFCSVKAPRAGSTDLHEVEIGWGSSHLSGKDCLSRPEDQDVTQEAPRASPETDADKVVQAVQRCHAELCTYLTGWLEHQDKTMKWIVACHERLALSESTSPLITASPVSARSYSKVGAMGEGVWSWGGRGLKKCESGPESRVEAADKFNSYNLPADSSAPSQKANGAENTVPWESERMTEQELGSPKISPSNSPRTWKKLNHFEEHHPMPSLQAAQYKANAAVASKLDAYLGSSIRSSEFAVSHLASSGSDDSSRVGAMLRVPNLMVKVISGMWTRRETAAADFIGGEAGKRQNGSEVSNRLSEADRQRKSKAIHASISQRMHRSRISAEIQMQEQDSLQSSIGIWTRHQIRRGTQSIEFTLVTSFLIVLYMIFLGVLVNSVSPANHELFTWINLAFAILFMLEIMLRIACDGLAFLCTRQHLFDVLVALAALGEAIFHLRKYPVSLYMMVNLLRAARFARIFKVLSLARLTRILQCVRVMTQSAVGTVRSLCCGLLLHAMTIYLFALVFTQAARNQEFSNRLSVEDLDKLDKNYGSVMLACLTLFQATTAGLDWREAMDPLNKISKFYGFLFMAFIMFVHFAVVNVITAFFCQQAIQTAQQDKDNIIQEHLQQKDTYTRQLEQLFQEIDTTTSGSVTLGDFELALNDHRIHAFFESLDIEISDAWTIFKLLDKHGTQDVNLEEFVVGCLRLRGAARSVDILKLIYDVEWLTRKMGQFIESTSDRGTIRESQTHRRSRLSCAARCMPASKSIVRQGSTEVSEVASSSPSVYSSIPLSGSSLPWGFRNACTSEEIESRIAKISECDDTSQ